MGTSGLALSMNSCGQSFSLSFMGAEISWSICTTGRWSSWLPDLVRKEDITRVTSPSTKCIHLPGEDSGTWKHSDLQTSFWTDHLKASHCFQCEGEDVWQDCCLGNRWGGGSIHLPGHRPHQPWKSSKNLTFIKSVIWKKKPQLAWSGVYETPRNWVERPNGDSVGKMQMLRPLTGGLLLSALVFTDL